MYTKFDILNTETWHRETVNTVIHTIIHTVAWTFDLSSFFFLLRRPFPFFTQERPRVLYHDGGEGGEEGGLLHARRPGEFNRESVYIMSYGQFKA